MTDLNEKQKLVIVYNHVPNFIIPILRNLCEHLLCEAKQSCYIFVWKGVIIDIPLPGTLPKQVKKITHIFSDCFPQFVMLIT